MSNSEDPVAGTGDVDIQTDVPRMCDASTQTDARETNPVYETTGPDKSLVVPSIPAAACAVKPEISVRIVDGKRIVDLPGCGDDRKGRYRPPFRSTHKVIVDTMSNFWPPRYSRLILPTTTNLNILLRALNYLLRQKYDAYQRHRSENPDSPLESYTRQMRKYEELAVAEAARAASRMIRPRRSTLELYYVDHDDEHVPVPNGGRLIFIRRRSDGWNVFHEPVENVAVECVKKNDICLWECEEALDEIYHWCRTLFLGSGPPYYPSGNPLLLEALVPDTRLHANNTNVS
ncbi:hypothetical protein F4813DRAFT_388427 [Daldinia decipiens]|uniref:uncharacterized protein n=1 Tax=Daldinia decipiens TaxID=326647 RepID=UPI0020C20324|nr:uncharacterized protein F4813DRAFT_388427 [Daldinia decipiens]KAI1658661.1 hypothetical protein F4813DRAFT_388427 [Daldinia decipiens]